MNETTVTTNTTRRWEGENRLVVTSPATDTKPAQEMTFHRLLPQTDTRPVVFLIACPDVADLPRLIALAGREGEERRARDCDALILVRPGQALADFDRLCQNLPEVLHWVREGRPNVPPEL